MLNQLDPLLHSELRLAVMSVLIALEKQILYTCRKRLVLLPGI